MNPEPLPGHELITEPFLRQWGAVEGMKFWHAEKEEWESFRMAHLMDAESKWTLDPESTFSAPLGTMAMLSTELPEVWCNCGASDKISWDPKDCQPNCPRHPRNRLVKVLPGWLARLKEKPERLMWAVSNAWRDQSGKNDGIPDWEPMDNSDWLSIIHWSIGVGDFAYALPAHVLAEIEGKEKDQEQSDEMVRCLSTTTSEEVKTCPDANTNTSTQTASALTAEGSNAAPPKSQPSGATATSPTADEMIDWLEMQVVEVHIPLRYGSRLLFIVRPEDLEGDVEPSALRLAIANEMKEGK